MQIQEARDTAHMMIRSYGLRAQAIAQERATELRDQWDTADLERWQQIHAAICELRRTGTRGRQPAAAA